jgi:hypothetical protein
MGNAGAKALGIKEAAIDVDTSVNGITKLVGCFLNCPMWICADLSGRCLDKGLAWRTTLGLYWRGKRMVIGV